MKLESKVGEDLILISKFCYFLKMFVDAKLEGVIYALHALSRRMAPEGHPLSSTFIDEI